MRKTLSSIALLILVIVSADVFVSFISCQIVSDAPSGYQYPVKYCSGLEGPLFSTLIWFTGILEDHSGAVIVAFTVILAISSIALWLSTRRLWSVTEKMTSHIPVVERAWVFASPDGSTARYEEGLLRFQIGIKNHGKTPGFLKLVWAKVDREEPLSPEPIYQGSEHRIETDAVISAGEYFTWPKFFYAAGERYFYGYIRYTDIFEETHVSRFCVRLVPDEGRFELAGHAAWNAHYTEQR